MTGSTILLPTIPQIPNTVTISYLIPETSYQFFQEIIPQLTKSGISVQVNQITEDTDLILAAIAPATPNWHKPIDASNLPLVLWHWDHYSFVDLSAPRWKWFLDRLPNCLEIWSGSYETARQLKELYELNSSVIPAWVNTSDFAGKYPVRDYVLYASHSASLGKRIDWAETACELLDYPLTLTKGCQLTREEYLRTIRRCRVYVSTAFEESNATIPAMEAAAAGRPVVLADIPSNREVFGSTGIYFNNWDFESLKRALKTAWELEGRQPAARQRIVKNYSLDLVSLQIASRLRSLVDASIRRGTRRQYGQEDNP